MNMRRLLCAGVSIAALLAAPSGALANFAVTQGSGTTILAIDAANQGTALCAASVTECPAHVLINTAGAPIGVSGTPLFTSLAGTTVPLPTGAATQTTSAAILTALGSPFQAGGSIGNTSFAISGTLPAFAATPTVNLGTLNGAATAANQTNASQKTQIVDSSGNVISSSSNNLNVQCANCTGSGVSAIDAATFTASTSVFAPGGGFYQTTATSNALTTGHQGAFQVTTNRALFTNLRNASGTELGVAAAPLQVSLANTATNATAVSVADASVVAQIVASQVPVPLPVTTDAYPTTAVPVTASATGTTASTAATLANVTGHLTYICGFKIKSNATGAATGDATVAGPITGTLHFEHFTAPLASGIGDTSETFTPCVPASAISTNIVVTAPAPGAGGVVTVSAWGFSI